jgi:hypothetical protein
MRGCCGGCDLNFDVLGITLQVSGKYQVGRFETNGVKIGLKHRNYPTSILGTI